MASVPPCPPHGRCARCRDLVVIPPAMEKYRPASRRILPICRDRAALVEPFPFDEAYLDVTDASPLRGSATASAQTVGIPASAGIAPNKFTGQNRERLE